MSAASSYSVILDRDKTINQDPGYLADPEAVTLMPGAAEGIALLNRFGIKVFVASNQSGVSRGLISHEQLRAVNARIEELLREGGAHVDGFFICPHQDHDECHCRKPKPGLVKQIIETHRIDVEKTFIAGDRARDLECGRPFGMRGILVGDEETQRPQNLVFQAKNLYEAAAFILETIFEEQTQKKFFNSVQDFLPELHKQRQAGRRIVFTNGCFDLLHSGHVQLLSQARALGDYLILGLNSDRSVRALKGPSRPVNSQTDRGRILAQLPYVDAVIVFDEDTPIELLKILQPDIQVKGGDYVKEQLPEYPVMQAMGKEIVILPFRKGYSTTAILTKSRQWELRSAVT
jgi:rfaE bifunctional protein nucleotidyltransferase chain/domain